MASEIANDIVNRALTVVKSNAEWINYIKSFNDPSGFVFCDAPLLDDIKEAVEE